MALLSVFGRLKSYFGGPLRVVHFHHGPSSDPRVQKFRDQAQNLVALETQQRGLEFLCFASPKVLQTEAQFRQFRRQQLQKLPGVLVTAHHGDDELETHILKLIRGGSSLSLQNFREWNGRTLRPFLQITKKKLRSYVKDQSLASIEDPTNTDVQALRNWLRQVWLPELEKKAPGGTIALGRSLKALVQEAQKAGDAASLVSSSENVFFRSHFRALSKDQSHVFLFRFLKSQFPQDYFSHGHIEEVRKNLDKVQNRHTFKIGPFEWKVNAEQIQVRKLDT